MWGWDCGRRRGFQSRKDWEKEGTEREKEGQGQFEFALVDDGTEVGSTGSPIVYVLVLISVMCFVEVWWSGLPVERTRRSKGMIRMTSVDLYTYDPCVATQQQQRR